MEPEYLEHVKWQLKEENEQSFILETNRGILTISNLGIECFEKIPRRILFFSQYITIDKRVHDSWPIKLRIICQRNILTSNFLSKNKYGQYEFTVNAKITNFEEINESTEDYILRDYASLGKQRINLYEALYEDYCKNYMDESEEFIKLQDRLYLLAMLESMNLKSWKNFVFKSHTLDLVEKFFSDEDLYDYVGFFEARRSKRYSKSIKKAWKKVKRTSEGALFVHETVKECLSKLHVFEMEQDPDAPIFENCGKDYDFEGEFPLFRRRDQDYCDILYFRKMEVDSDEEVGGYYVFGGNVDLTLCDMEADQVHLMDCISCGRFEKIYNMHMETEEEKIAAAKMVFCQADKLFRGLKIKKKKGVLFFDLDYFYKKEFWIGSFLFTLFVSLMLSLLLVPAAVLLDMICCGIGSLIATLANLEIPVFKYSMNKFLLEFGVFFLLTFVVTGIQITKSFFDGIIARFRIGSLGKKYRKF